MAPAQSMAAVLKPPTTYPKKWEWLHIELSTREDIPINGITENLNALLTACKTVDLTF